MTRRLAAWFLVILVSTANAEDYPKEVAKISIKSSADGTAQPALFYAPADKRGTPLLVALHTWSSDWDNSYNIPLAEGCIEREWAFIHPGFRGPNKKPDACGSEFAVSDIKDAVAWAIREHKVDPQQVYLAGASGGGHMSLLMAGRAPELWAAVSSWVPISDCAAWHADCIASGRHYAKDLELVCGGKPGDSAEIDQQYKQRSPLTWLSNAKGVPVSINAGIRDGHEGSVPIDHTLRAFNVLAKPTDQVGQDAVAHMVKAATLPKGLASGEPMHIDAFEKKKPLWQRSSGNAQVTIFDGGHEMVPAVIFEFLEGKRRSAKK